VGDPEGVAAHVGVADAVPPEVGAGVDDRGAAGGGAHQIDPLAHRRLNLSAATSIGGLDVDHRGELAAVGAEGLDHQVRLIAHALGGPEELIRPAVDAHAAGLGPVAAEEAVAVARSVAHPDEGEADAAARDLIPVDGALPLGDVDAAGDRAVGAGGAEVFAGGRDGFCGAQAAGAGLTAGRDGGGGEEESEEEVVAHGASFLGEGAAHGVLPSR
jgi:hypothetical protein